MGIYLHIPFCEKKCAYCDFLSAAVDKKTQKQYMEALLREIKSYKSRVDEYEIGTIFIGGGTPSIVDPTYIREIINMIKEIFHLKNNVEITIEANPGTIDIEKLETYKAAGINRLSIGLQSTSDRELKSLGRIHSYKEFKDNYILAREIGFNNINIDLISSLPGQSLKSWDETLRTVCQLEPEHISAYSLIIEEGTPFYDLYSDGKAISNDLPDEDTDRLIYKHTERVLKEYGYNKYEISNYAKPGYECKHNISYWIGTDYLAFGIGAASLIKNTRFNNESNLEKYISLCDKNIEDNLEGTNSDIMADSMGIRRDISKPSKKEQMEEFMFLGLRLKKGISKKEFEKRFNIKIDNVYGDILEKLFKDKLLINNKNRVYLTDYGTDISNYVLAHFIFD